MRNLQQKKTGVICEIKDTARRMDRVWKMKKFCKVKSAKEI